jgi:ribosomal protein L11 methyltransferase
MIRLAVRVRREDAELALAELVALAPGGGLEEVDLGDRVEYAIYGAEGELPALPDLEAAAGDALVEVVTTQVEDDWAERWRAFHKPVVAGGLFVRAPWHAPAQDGMPEVVVDPGQAFGTGAHDTTRLCLELLEAVDPALGGVMDVGCGSGVLAIAAARRGFSPVAGVDHDPLAVDAARHNAEANGVTLDVWRHDLLRDGPVPGAPVVLANLLRPLLLRVAQDGFSGPRPEVLVASGLLRREADEVAAAFAARLGLVEEARAEGGDWAALRLRFTAS